MATPDLTTEEGISTYLHSANFSFCPNVTKVERLPEGFGGFVFRVHSKGSNPPSIIVKHAEGYAARAQSWKLDQDRMLYECKAMEYLSQPRMQSDESIRVPKLLHYDDQNHVLVMEDAGDLPSLKGWLQPDMDIQTTEHIGESLGRYLAKVHNSTAGVEDVLADFNGNETGKYLSGTLYFGMLPAAAEKYGFTDACFSEAAKFGEKEVRTSNEVLTLGDFWTGNVLVDAKGPEATNLYVLDFELSKPGTAAFDIGQMAAEMYCLAAYRDHALGMALYQGFLRSYKENRDDVVDAAKVAIRIGAHFLVMMPRAWANEASPKKIGEVVQMGAELICMGWKGDEAGLRDSIVGTLM